MHMKEFLEAMEKYTPTIPEELVSYYLQLSGVDTKDPNILRLIAVATHKFLSDITTDALQYHRIRTQSKKNSNSSTSSQALTLQDLTTSLKGYGINVNKPQYYCDHEAVDEEE